MRVLVIGSGAREHALVWKLAQSPRVTSIYAAPGNPGMVPYASLVPARGTSTLPAPQAGGLHMSHLVELADFAERTHIDLTVVGPEVPLVAGIADIFQERMLPIFGPAAAAAALEWSKAFAKELMTQANIPTARHRTFTQAAEALAYLDQHGV